MKRTYEIMTDMNKFTKFVNSLSENKKKFSITQWCSRDRTENGFVVWYYI